MLGKIKDSAAYISRFLEGEKYRIGIILGTGLGELGKSIEIKLRFPRPEFLISGIHRPRTQRKSINREIRREKRNRNAGTFSFL